MTPDLAWALEARIDDAAVSAVLDQLPPLRGEESDLLAQAIACIDLTTLSGDDTPDRVRRLCQLAAERRTAAVCVFPYFVEIARGVLEGSGVRVATVAGGFPAGLTPLHLRVAEVRAATSAGADEIDVVINRAHVLTGSWEALHHEIGAFREAAGDRTLKVILATGELGTLTHVAIASRVALLAGADFLKTSTGKEAVNATLPAGLVMLDALGEYEALTGRRAGLKPAGGIRTPEQALEWIRLVGEEEVQPARFRIGTSGLLGEIVRRTGG